MGSSTTYVQQVAGGRPPEGGLVAEVSADDNEVLSEEQEVERKSGTMRGCDIIPASILKSTTSYIQYICSQNGTKLKHSLLASDCHLKEKVLYRCTGILTTANWHNNYIRRCIDTGQLRLHHHYIIARVSKTVTR